MKTHLRRHKIFSNFDTTAEITNLQNNMDHVIYTLIHMYTYLMGGTSWDKNGISHTLSYSITLHSIFL